MLFVPISVGFLALRTSLWVHGIPGKSGSLVGAGVLSTQGGWEGTWCVLWDEWVDPD